MVGSARFELATCRLGGGCSIHLSYEPTIENLFIPNVRITWHQLANVT